MGKGHVRIIKHPVWKFCPDFSSADKTAAQLLQNEDIQSIHSSPVGSSSGPTGL